VGIPPEERGAFGLAPHTVEQGQQLRSWAFITNHGLVLLAVAQDPGRRVSEIATASGITERSTYRILSDLVESGYLRRVRVGRLNRYELDRDQPLADPVVKEDTVRDLLALIEARGG
jgi:DNA-binding transcriptional ArsR family regulator